MQAQKSLYPATLLVTVLGTFNGLLFKRLILILQANLLLQSLLWYPDTAVRERHMNVKERLRRLISYIRNILKVFQDGDLQYQVRNFVFCIVSELLVSESLAATESQAAEQAKPKEPWRRVNTAERCRLPNSVMHSLETGTTYIPLLK